MSATVMVASPPANSRPGTSGPRPVAGTGSTGAGRETIARPSGREATVDSSLTAETSDSQATEGLSVSHLSAARGASWRAAVSDLLQLTKPRIVVMILITTAVAAVIAAGSMPSLLLMLHLIVGTALVAGSAGAMNQVWEREIDGRMKRTSVRPLPAGRLTCFPAFLFASLIGLLGTVYLAAAVGMFPAAFAVLTWVLYVPIYTPLKTRSEWNTTVGAVSGALPMMIGFTACGGSPAAPAGWLLVGVLAAWQYPHFMAIAWLYRRQYDEAGFRMTTTVEPTGRRAAMQSVAGMLALFACLAALAISVAPGPVAAAVLIVASAAVTYPMFAASLRFFFRRDDASARSLLRTSLLQLPASLLLLTAATLYFQ